MSLGGGGWGLGVGGCIKYICTSVCMYVCVPPFMILSLDILI